MRLHHLAIVLALALVGCAKKQQAPDAKKPVPAATTPSDPQPAEAAPAAAPAPAPAASEAPAPGSRSPVKKGGDPEDGGQ
jgi:hypothetical protein